MAVGPIPWSAVDRYAERYGLDDDSYAYFQALIKALDAAYLKHQDDNKSKDSHPRIEQAGEPSAARRRR